MNPSVAILIVSILYYLIILWMQYDHANILRHQRDRILKLIEENQILAARLRLRGGDITDIESNVKVRWGKRCPK